MAFLVLAFLFSCGPARHTPSDRHKKKESGFVAIPDGNYSTETTASYLYTEGIRHSMIPDNEAVSLELFKRVLKIDSLHAPSYFEIANLLSDTPEKALSYSQQANRLDPANTWYRSQLGRLYIATEQYDSALTIYNDLLRIAPENPENYRLLAALYDQQGLPFTAITVLDSAENRFGMREEISYYKRQLLVQVKMYDKAISEAKAIALNFPYEESNFTALAELYAATGKDSLAMDAYNRALELNPTSIQTLVSLNEYYKNKQDNVNFLATAKQLFNADDIPLDGKLRFFSDIIKSRNFYSDNYYQIADLVNTLAIKYPEDFQVTEIYAGHLIASGQLEEALRLYKAQLDKPEQRIEVYNNIIDIEAYLDRPDSVTKYAAMAIRAFPSDPQLYIRKGSVMSYFMHDYAGAEAEYKQALKLASNDSLRSVIYGILGDNSHSAGNSKAAFKYYQKGLRYDPDNAVINNNYSYYLSVIGESLDKAFAMAKRANELSPNNSTYLDTYAWVLYKMGRFEEAKVIMRQAISLDSSNSKELLIHYGDILYELKDYLMAGFYWKKALESGYDPDEIAKRLKWIENK